MSGQSNMVGFGQVAGTGPGTLQTITGAENKFPNLVASGGGWTTRNDVKYHGVISDVAKGNLKPDVAGDKFGPELGFGHVMGWYHDEPVLLIKASQGNRGLMWDFLPPGSPRTVHGATTYPAYGESPETWATHGRRPITLRLVCRQAIRRLLPEGKRHGALAPGPPPSAIPQRCQVRHNGVVYISKSAHTSAAASEPGVGANSADLSGTCIPSSTPPTSSTTSRPSIRPGPRRASKSPASSGGRATMTRANPGRPATSRTWCSSSSRSAPTTKTAIPAKTVPNAPFVLATLAADGGWGNTERGYAKVAQAQLNVDGTAGIYPEFAGNVKTMEARGFWRGLHRFPHGQGYHYNWNAETYLLVGDALGRAMVELLSADDYGTWSATYPGADLTDPNADLDGDGLSNDHERIWGLDPTRGSSAHPLTSPPPSPPALSATPAAAPA